MGKRKGRQKFIYRHTLLQEEIEMSTRERRKKGKRKLVMKGETIEKRKNLHSCDAHFRKW